MKTAIAILLAIGASFAPGTLIQAASGTPEIDKANATFSLQGQLVSKQCTGEDAKPYVTFRGKWSGTQTETTPGATDYGLSGTLTISPVVWTINTATRRGVLTGTVKLVDTTGVAEYTGKLTLVTQSPAAGGTTPGRGFIVAGFAPADDGAPPPGDDTLVANVEMMISTSGVTGAFGDSAPFSGISNYSVVTNVVPKAADGLC